MLALCPPLRAAPCCVRGTHPTSCCTCSQVRAHAWPCLPLFLPGRDPVPPARPFGKGPLSSASAEFPRVQPSFQGL